MVRIVDRSKAKPGYQSRQCALARLPCVGKPARSFLAGMKNPPTDSLLWPESSIICYTALQKTYKVMQIDGDYFDE